jgi:hypothetical protein
VFFLARIQWISWLPGFHFFLPTAVRSDPGIVHSDPLSDTTPPPKMIPLSLFDFFLAVHHTALLLDHQQRSLPPAGKGKLVVYYIVRHDGCMPRPLGAP